MERKKIILVTLTLMFSMVGGVLGTLSFNYSILKIPAYISLSSMGLISLPTLYIIIQDHFRTNDYYALLEDLAETDMIINLPAL